MVERDAVRVEPRQTVRGVRADVKAHQVREGGAARGEARLGPDAGLLAQRQIRRLQLRHSGVLGRAALQPQRRAQHQLRVLRQPFDGVDHGRFEQLPQRRRHMRHCHPRRHEFARPSASAAPRRPSPLVTRNGPTACRVACCCSLSRVAGVIVVKVGSCCCGLRRQNLQRAADGAKAAAHVTGRGGHTPRAQLKRCRRRHLRRSTPPWQARHPLQPNNVKRSVHTGIEA